MAVQKLTATKIDKYKPTTADENLTDGNGLYIRFRKGQTGSISRRWMYTYKVGTSSQYVSLGDHEAPLSDFEINLYQLAPNARLTLENARKIAIEMTARRKRGVMPKEFIEIEAARYQQQIDLEAQQAKEGEEAQALLEKQLAAENRTVQELFDAWVENGVRRKDGNAEISRSFNANVLPLIGAIAVKQLTEHDLRSVLRALVARGVNRTAVLVCSDLTQMFAWAEQRKPWRQLLIDGNPMALIDIEKIVSPDYDMDNICERRLSPDEIRELRQILESMEEQYANAPNKRVASQPLEVETQCAIWIMLSTLCRVGELSMARWEHVNLQTGHWFIPKRNVKNCVGDLDVYLSPFALRAFTRLHQHTGHSNWCFPANNTKADTHVCVKSKTKQIGDRQAMFKVNADGTPRKALKGRRRDNSLVLAGGKNGCWTPHDLRRTGATIMQGLGITMDIIDRCQNHVLPGSKTRRHYLHHEYEQETRVAWHLLGERLQSILDGVEEPVVHDMASALSATKLMQIVQSMHPAQLMQLMQQIPAAHLTQHAR